MDYEAILKCEVCNSVLSTERGVTVYDANKNMLARGIFPQHLVTDGGLAVRVTEEKGDKFLVESVNGGGYGFLESNRIWVPKELVR